MSEDTRRETKEGVERPERPTPARGTAAEVTVGEVTVAEAPSGLSTREITVDDELWLARPTGSGTVGAGLTHPARVIEITFRPAADPKGAERRTLTTVSSFESLSDEALAELFRHAAP